MKTYVIFLSLCAFFFGVNSVFAGDLALTPVGYRSRSTLRAIRQGERVQPQENTQRQENSLFGDFLPSLTNAFHDSGWITTAYWTIAGDSVSSFSSTWQVPEVPAARSGQTLFYFNGIMDSASSNILQPVLQWGSAADGGGEYWSIASWYVGTDGTFFTTPIPVNVGQTLTGVMTLTKSTGGSFSYHSEFTGVPGTSLPVDNIRELVILSETLEAYSVFQCSEYSSTKVAFTNIGLKTANGTGNLDWAVSSPSTNCGQRTVVASNSPTNGEVDILP